MAKKKDTNLLGPLYTEPTPGKSLGAEKVEGPTGGKPVPDPLGYVKSAGTKK